MQYINSLRRYASWSVEWTSDIWLKLLATLRVILQTIWVKKTLGGQRDVTDAPGDDASGGACSLCNKRLASEVHCHLPLN